ncbi:glycosyltransferase family 4 protein [Pontibacter vulgaris]|uniref:glycosyltransferase family 4 protein n=1 Tax=Pontibacter vulgaris TaxID=2905679 RepID=UPI001FA7157A|nr:glycosyltransferase family 4 protein [Pontibacter vulgaris]
MKILIIHNKYKEKGGEDNSFAAECAMLSNYGHDVRTLVFDNKDIDSWMAVAKLSYQMFYNSDSAASMEQEILAFRPDVIHVHNFFYVASPSVFYIANKHNIPVVFTVRNFRLICSGAFLLRDGKVCEQCITKQLPLDGIMHGCHRNSRMQTAQLTLMTSLHKMAGTWRNKITRYIVLTEFAKNKLLSSSLKLRPEQIVVKPNCVTDQGYTLPEEREDYFLFVGRLSEEKGLDVLLKARDLVPYKLKIIGTGPLVPMVEEYAAKYSDVEYLGFQDNAFIVDALKKSQALLFPSIWYEGMPRTILEAFSTGTPVIASDIDNINEIVENNYNGIHFKTSSPESLAEVIRNYSPGINPAHRALYEQARQTFIDKFTYEGNYQQLISIYENLITNKERLPEQFPAKELI